MVTQFYLRYLLFINVPCIDEINTIFLNVKFSDHFIAYFKMLITNLFGWYCICIYVVVLVNNLGLHIDNSLRFKHRVFKCVQLPSAALKMLYLHKPTDIVKYTQRYSLLFCSNVYFITIWFIANIHIHVTTKKLIKRL